MDFPSLNDLRALALSLPPSERVSAAEAADLLSALAAVGAHGDSILEAAREGKIYDFYHDAAVQHAQDNGHDEPVRGATTPADPAARPATAPQSQGIDYDALADAIVRRQQAQAPPDEVAGPHTDAPEVTDVQHEGAAPASASEVV